MEEPGVSQRDYLERNTWIKGEDREAYVKSWAISQTDEALDWIKDHDRGILPHTIREVCPVHHSKIANWIKRQTDPEIKTMGAKALAAWEKAERKKDRVR